MVPIKFILVAFVTVQRVSSEQVCNASGSSDGNNRSNRREPRFIRFNNAEGDIALDMDLNLPFAKIPVKETTNAMLSMANGIPSMKVKPLLIGASAVVSGIVLVVGLMKFSRLRSVDSKGLSTLYPSNLNGDETVSDLLQILEKSLLAQGIDLATCTQKTICSLVRTSTKSARRSSLHRIIDGVTSSLWFSRIITRKAVKDAAIVGRIGVDCDQKYPICRFSSDNLYSSVINSLNTIGNYI